MLNKELQDSLKVKAEYDKLNARTVERVKTYDPRLKMWTFERIHTDPDAHKMNIKPARQRNSKVIMTSDKPAAEDKNAVIIKMLKAKKSLPEIAKTLGMSYNAVSHQCKKIYIQYPELKARRSKENSKEKLLQMRKDGKSQKEMSAVTGLAISTIKEYLRLCKSKQG